jgi:hypothetical protein
MGKTRQVPAFMFQRHKILLRWEVGATGSLTETSGCMYCMLAVVALPRPVLMPLTRTNNGCSFSQHGATALMSASWNGYLDSVQKLLEAGADSDLRDKVRHALRVVT